MADTIFKTMVRANMPRPRRFLFRPIPKFIKSIMTFLLDPISEKEAKTIKYIITNMILALSAPNLYISGSWIMEIRLVKSATRLKSKTIGANEFFIIIPTIKLTTRPIAEIIQTKVYLDKTIFSFFIPVEIIYLSLWLMSSIPKRIPKKIVGIRAKVKGNRASWFSLWK